MHRALKKKKKKSITINPVDEESDPEIHLGTDTWVSNLTYEVPSWTHKREMVSSEAIKQGQ